MSFLATPALVITNPTIAQPVILVGTEGVHPIVMGGHPSSAQESLFFAQSHDNHWLGYGGIGGLFIMLAVPAGGGRSKSALAGGFFGGMGLVALVG